MAAGPVAFAEPAAPLVRGLGLAWHYGLLLVGAVLGSHLLAMVLLQQAGALVHPISREQAVAVLAAAHALARAAPTEDLPAGLDALARAQQTSTDAPAPAASPTATRLWVAATPEVPAFAMLPEEAALAEAVRVRLGLAADTPVWAQVERASGEQARASPLSLAAWEPLRLRASVGLPGGGWLNAQLGLQGRYDWLHILRITLPASVLPVLVVSLLLTWRLLRPLRALAAAAARLDYGRRQPPLPLCGPRELRELTQRFNAMQQRIATDREARTRLLAAISHDLRTPVTALRVQLALVDDEALREDMQASVAELQALVAATLDFGRADAGAQPLQPTDIAALLRALVARHQSLGHDVQLAPDVPSALEWPANPLGLGRALSNLVDNAVRHAGSACIALERSAAELRIRVLDDGPGIAEADLEAVFEPFRQLDGARGPDRGGVGLGLSIARSCVQAQDGTLTLAARPGGGLCACIALPAPAAAQTPR